jgi:hypothetical protein
MKSLALRVICGFGRGLRSGLVAVGALAFLGTAVGLADYFATVPGSGTTFASIVIASKHYAAMVWCDATIGETQCAAVNSSGQVAVQAPPSLPLPTGASTSANQTTANAALGSPTDVPCTLPASATSCSQTAIQKATANAANGPLAGQSVLTVPIGQIGGEVNVPPTDCSGTITTGGTAQTLIAASATIHGFTLKNIDASTGSGELIWFSLTGTATATTSGSYELIPPASTTQDGGSYTTPLGFGVNHTVSIVGATTGHKYTCTTW